MIIYYIIFFFLILRFTVTLFNMISNPKLTMSPRRYTDKVSVLIPARNEEASLPGLLISLMNQDYQNIEVIVLDDNSTDHTYPAAESLCKQDSRFHVVKGLPLPDGWLGKNFACYQLAELATGDYFLFLDADELVADGLINNAVHRMKMNRQHLLSLFTNQEMKTLGEYTVVPLMHFVLLNLLPLRLVRLSNNPSFAAASGQFMLFDAENYRNRQWHKQVKNRVVEDIEIMKALKAEGFKGEALLANGYIRCRMYSGYGEAIRGFGKNFLAGFNDNIPMLLIYLLLVVFGPIYVAVYLNFQLLFFAVTLIILSRVMIAYLSGQKVWINVLLHPIQIINMLIIAGLSIKNHVSGNLTWKGRKINRF
ncbi:glycosyltransferase (plasmid) [Pedobacter sp. BS3]|uniref:glycosyltransferase n=1 Tax=Pedobacter sp. BS3 TaxID=2567937 RepID=UPI0011EBEFB3|nr:glycosyltransferase [Pedobacter sp. BS3]TZF86086.1 glycosyltransferase [Pedobacter sp. BS3]